MQFEKQLRIVAAVAGIRSLRHLAIVSGTSRHTVWAIFRGRRSEPQTRARLARALRIPESQLVALIALAVEERRS